MLSGHGVNTVGCPVQYEIEWDSWLSAMKRLSISQPTHDAAQHTDKASNANTLTTCVCSCTFWPLEMITSGMSANTRLDTCKNRPLTPLKPCTEFCIVCDGLANDQSYSQQGFRLTQSAVCRRAECICRDARQHNCKSVLDSASICTSQC